jgi:hypothetical protein
MTFDDVKFNQSCSDRSDQSPCKREYARIGTLLSAGGSLSAWLLHPLLMATLQTSYAINTFSATVRRSPVATESGGKSR